MMHRRDLLNAAVLAGGVSLIRAESGRADDSPMPPARIIDTNISLFQWPFRRLPLEGAGDLVRKLRSLGITEAWAGSFEALLHRDVRAVNERLIEICERHAELTPVGCVNPELPGWEDDFHRCAKQHDMPAIRLHPNYHGYTLADPRFRRLLELAASAAVFVQIAVTMEDVRTQHPMLHVPDTDLVPLAALVRDTGAAVQLLNDRPRGSLLDTLANTPGIYFDTARVDGTDGVRQLLESVPHGRVLFGSHAPFLIPEAALIRVGESKLDAAELESLLWANAQQARGART